MSNQFLLLQINIATKLRMYTHTPIATYTCIIITYLYAQGNYMHINKATMYVNYCDVL